MARLIDAGGAQHLSSTLRVRPGDLIRFSASGGQVTSGSEALEILGSFMPAVVGTHGQVVAPMAAAPNTVLFRARQPGVARIDIVRGDPWHGSTRISLEIEVEPRE